MSNCKGLQFTISFIILQLVIAVTLHYVNTRGSVCVFCLIGINGVYQCSLWDQLVGALED